MLIWWVLPVGGVASGRVCACSLRSRLVYFQVLAQRRGHISLCLGWKHTASITHSRGYFLGQTLLCLLWAVFRASPEFCIFLQYPFHICPTSTHYGAVLCCFVVYPMQGLIPSLGFAQSRKPTTSWAYTWLMRDDIVRNPNIQMKTGFITSYFSLTEKNP